MKKLCMTFFAVAIGLCLGLGSLPKAQGQETKSEEFTLEEITVTAEKRTVNIQKEAMNIAAISGDDIKEHALSSVADVLDGLAGVKVMGSQLGGNIFIRGIGSGIDTNMASPSVALQKDNVYIGQAEGVMSGIYDVDRIEVLYGPQGTLYGRNAAGGQVNVITKNPTFTKFEANGSLSIGNYNKQDFSAALNMPFSSTFSARLAIDEKYHSAYISDGSGTDNKISSRIKMLYKPSDKASFLLTGDFTWDKSKVKNTVPVPGSAGQLPPPMPWVDATIPTTGWVIPTGGDAWTNDVYHPAPVNNTKYQLFSLQADIDMGFAKLTLIPTLNMNDRDFWSNLITGDAVPLAAGGGLSEQRFKEKQWTGEARLANGENSPVSWVVGLYYLKSNNRNPLQTTQDARAVAEAAYTTGLVQQGPGGGGGINTSTIGEKDLPLVSNYQTPKDTYAAFGQMTYPVTDKFRLVGGVRYNNDNNDLKMRIIIWDMSGALYPDYYAKSVAVGGRHEYDSGVFTYTNKSQPFTYKGGIEYDLDSSKMLYAGIATGFKAGGLNTMAIFPPLAFDPEKLTSYSAGAKTRFMNNQLQLNIEAYYYDYNGYQVQLHGGTFVDPLTGQVNTGGNFMGNAKKGNSFGLEFRPDWLITANDRVTAEFAYMKTKLGELVLPANMGAPPLDVTGTDLPNAPHLSGTLSYEHIFYLEDGSTVTPKFSTKITEGYWNTIEKNQPGAYQGSYSMSDFYLTYASASGKYIASLWGKNLEETVATDYVFPLYRRVIMDPRTYGLTFSVKF
jgi:iron complex outermembrane recepter protein